MSWFKLLTHDFRCGLLRLRYLAIPGIFLLSCISCRSILHGGTWGDYLMYYFMGSKSLEASAGALSLQLPIFWILATGGCLLINLDFLLNDLSKAGQQMIIRAGTRSGWYLAKCVWNAASCVVYFVIAVLTALIYTLAAGGRAVLENTPEITQAVFFEVLNDSVSLSAKQVFLCAVFLPLMTVTAISEVQMLLCLFVKPAVSFLMCMILLIAAVYWENPFILGNGAMVMRCDILVEGGVSARDCALFAVIVIVICTIFGMSAFRRKDILSLEE